jgi:hypothetical protein
MLSKFLEKASAKTNLLAQDVSSIAHNKKEGTSPSSRKSVEPITRLRKDKAELEQVNNTDPEIQFIKDQLNDVFGG